MARELVHPMRVRFAECDPQSVVFNSRYLEYFDVAMTELWREAVGPYEEKMGDLGVDMVVAEASLRYLAPLRFDDEFELRASVTRLGTTSMITAIGVHRAEAACVLGELRHVFVRIDGGEKTEIPAEVRAGLAPYLRDGRSSAG
jgi:acyl-CoA thioester hydrolase